MPTSATFLVDLTSALIGSVCTGKRRRRQRVARQLADQHRAEAAATAVLVRGRGEPGAAIRKFFRGEIGWDADQSDVMGYWQRDSEAWNRRYARIGSQLLGIYERLSPKGKVQACVGGNRWALERAGLSDLCLRPARDGQTLPTEDVGSLPRRPARELGPGE